MKLLFISRAYPPVVGGIENHNYELSRYLPHHADVTTIANTRGKKALPFFLPWMLLKLPFILHRYDALLLGDGVLSVLGAWAKVLRGTKLRVACVVHGLDITFTSKIYQRFWVKVFLPRCDTLIAVGNETIRQAVARGVRRECLTFIPNGIDVARFSQNTIGDNGARTQLFKEILGINDDAQYVIVTSGRLAKRKGVAWFIRNVLPELPVNTLYIVAGSGPDQENIEAAIAEKNLTERVVLLGYVEDTVRDTLWHGSDLFVQPNITVPGDMEGFGISVIEASTAGIPLITSATEGLLDAIKDGHNGFHAPVNDVAGWVAAVQERIDHRAKRTALGERARSYNALHYDWDLIAKTYCDTIEG